MSSHHIKQIRQIGTFGDGQTGSGMAQKSRKFHDMVWFWVSHWPDTSYAQLA